MMAMHTTLIWKETAVIPASYVSMLYNSSLFMEFLLLLRLHNMLRASDRLRILSRLKWFSNLRNSLLYISFHTLKVREHSQLSKRFQMRFFLLMDVKSIPPVTNGFPLALAGNIRIVFCAPVLYADYNKCSNLINVLSQ